MLQREGEVEVEKRDVGGRAHVHADDHRVRPLELPDHLRRGIYICVSVYLYTHTHTQTHRHTDTQTHIDTHRHTQTHTDTHSLSPLLHQTYV